MKSIDIEEQLISFETAKLAKEKGFDIHCRWYFDDENGDLYENEDFPYNSWNGSLFAPTQSLLQKWLRELHKCNVYVIPYTDEEDDVSQTLYSFAVIMEDEEFDDSEYFHTYEEALESGLKTVLKLI